MPHLPLAQEERELQLSDRFELDNKHLQHPHEELTPLALLLLTAGPDALHQVKEQLARHGLDTATHKNIITLNWQPLPPVGV
jgi:hypothetical protein